MSHIPKPRAKLKNRTQITQLKSTKRYARNRYNKYKYFNKELNEIQTKLSDPKYGDCAFIAFEHKFPSSTVRTWKAKIKNDPNYDIEKGYKRNRRAIFTESEEEAIADYIRTNILGTGQLFTDDDFRIIAFAAYYEKYYDREDAPRFSCSKGFIYDFKKRHRFSSRRGHLKRRPTVNDDELRMWKRKIRDIIKNNPGERVVNVDETAWFFYPRGLLTWATKGESNISISISGSDKDNITALCAITAAGTKLPMMLIAAGKTDYVESSQLGDIGHHWSCHSESGWSTEETFVQYIQHIGEYFNNQEVHLLLDVYTAHRTDTVKETAHSYNIHLHFIPPGCTDLVQPLDVKVFGALKSKARALFRERYNGVMCPRVTSRDAVQNLIKAWEGISTYIIEEAWEVYDINE